MTKQFYFEQFRLAWVRSLHVKTVLFQAIQFGISTLFSSICHIDRTLSGATIQGHSEPRRDGNERVFYIPQSSSITGTLPSDFLISYPGHLLGWSYTSAEVQSVYSTAPADWAKRNSVLWYDTQLYRMIKYKFWNLRSRDLSFIAFNSRPTLSRSFNIFWSPIYRV